MGGFPRQTTAQPVATHSIQIGPISIAAPSVLAPMAGITDLPFRTLCRALGAGLAPSEMLTADTQLWHTHKSRQRLPNLTEAQPRSVQIVGADPAQLADAARRGVALGAQIVDINMGCPAKKVCSKAAGSALLADEALVAKILNAVVNAVEVPVTLKIRTGTCPQKRNGVRIARIAEDAGIRALAVHGRTRACRFNGNAEYDTIAAIVARVSIPVLANGDIRCVESAAAVLHHTGAAGLMIGRGAQGNPWLFREINHYLRHRTRLPPPDLQEIFAVLRAHLRAIHDYYGEHLGVRIARKHLGWYLVRMPNGEALRQQFNTLPACGEQNDFVETLSEQTLSANLLQKRRDEAA